MDKAIELLIEIQTWMMEFNTELWQQETKHQELRSTLLKWRGYLDAFQGLIHRARTCLEQVGHTSAHDLLTAFLAERRKSKIAGGWAEIGPGDLPQFADLLREIISTKWEGDADGWCPVVVTITDRTRHITPKWFQQPREEHPKALVMALQNLGIALQEVDLCLRLGCRLESNLADSADLVLEKLTENVFGAGEWSEVESLQAALDAWKEMQGDE